MRLENWPETGKNCQRTKHFIEGIHGALPALQLAARQQHLLLLLTVGATLSTGRESLRLGSSVGVQGQLVSSCLASVSVDVTISAGDRKRMGRAVGCFSWGRLNQSRKGEGCLDCCATALRS